MSFISMQQGEVGNEIEINGIAKYEQKDGS